jgi:hypothetical protein
MFNLSPLSPRSGYLRFTLAVLTHADSRVIKILFFATSRTGIIGGLAVKNAFVSVVDCVFSCQLIEFSLHQEIEKEAR